MKRLLSVFLFIVTASVSTFGFAGTREDAPVKIESLSVPGWVRASGMMGTARASFDLNQFIGCTTHWTSNGSGWISCSARDAAGKQVACMSQFIVGLASEKLAYSVPAIASDSRIEFTTDASSALNDCMEINVSTYSGNRTKGP